MDAAAVSEVTGKVLECVNQDGPGSASRDPKSVAYDGRSGVNCPNKNGIKHGEESVKFRTKSDSRAGTKPVERDNDIPNRLIVPEKLAQLVSKAIRRQEAVHRGIASALCEEKQFTKALTVLRRIHTDNCFDVDTMLLRAECTIVSQGSLQYDRMVADFIYTASICSVPPDYVHKWGKEMATQGRRVAAVLLYRAVLETCVNVDLFSEEYYIWCTHVVSDIRELASFILDAGEKYERQFIHDYAVSFMSQVYEAGKSIECLPTEICRRQKALMYASCTCDIAEICGSLKMYNWTIRFAREGIAGVRQFTEDSTVPSGHLLHLEGEAHLLIGDYRNGVRCLVDAAVEFQKAVDFLDVKDRKHAILSVQNTLKLNAQ